MEKRIKIAIVCGTMNIGGGEIMASELAGYIDEEKFQVKYFINGEYVENQIAKTLKETNVDFECLNLNTSFNFKDYKKFSRALKMFGPDVVHEHLDANYSWVWTFLNNRPLLSTQHSDPFRRRDKRVCAIINAKSMQRNLTIVGCSKKTAQLVKECYKLNDSYITHIYNPIEVDRFYHIKKDGTVKNLLAMGRLHQVKNYPLMLNAIKKVLETGYDVKLHIAGSGPLESELKAEVQRLSLVNNVVFLGNQKNIPELLSGMDALLLSSANEACPMVILEAMASGLPVVVTNVGGVPELVTDNGIVVESGDTEAFCNAIIKLLESPKLAEEMSKKALEYSKQYDKDIIVRQYENEYIKLLKRKVK